MKRITTLAGATLAGLLAAVVAPAWAQTSNSGVGNGAGQSSAQASGQASPQPPAPPPAQSDVAPAVEHLFGDWWGARTYLENRGIFLTLDALTEFAGNVSGGVKQGATFANQIGFEADIDWQRLAGVTGFSSHMIIVNRSGANDSTLFGDNLLPVQEIYGSGGNVALHLVSIYAEEKLLDGRVDLAAGRMNVENDFASSPLYCNYMNNVLCGDPKALPGGDIGHSAYPDGVWAGRVRVRPVADTFVVAGVYEVSQGLYGDIFRSGWEFDSARDSGVYLPVEVGYEPLLGDGKLPGHYIAGFGYDSSTPTRTFRRADVAIGRAGPNVFRQHAGLGLGGPDAAAARGGQPGRRHRTGRLDHNNPENSSYAEQYSSVRWIAASGQRGRWTPRRCCSPTTR